MGSVFLGPILAIPLSRLTALKTLAQRARERLVLVPEERTAPPELQTWRNASRAGQQFLAKRYAGDYGLLQAILDPHQCDPCPLLRQRETVTLQPANASARWGSGSFRMARGPQRAGEKHGAMGCGFHDDITSQTLESPAADLHEWWQMAFRRYNESLELCPAHDQFFRMKWLPPCTNWREQVHANCQPAIGFLQKHKQDTA
jgi:hypothetical protein